jgi:hypothetical protein
MNRHEAIKALDAGHKVRHEYFSPDEWVRVDGAVYVFEDGVECSSEEFWEHRQAKHFDEGWEISDTLIIDTLGSGFVETVPKKSKTFPMFVAANMMFGGLHGSPFSMPKFAKYKRGVSANVRTGPKETGRNEPCPCGSGKKFKKCCIQ